jgi:histidine triad protein
MYDLLKYNNKTIKLIYENQLAIAFFDKFPINEGHMLIITKKHYPTF